MKKTVICGGKTLYGEVEAHGAKNSVLPILAASVLTKEPILLTGCPPLKDVLAMVELLNSIGCTARFHNGSISIDCGSIADYKISDSLMGRLRSSIFILGPLLARMGKAQIGYPGGCDIGIRPIDLHLKGLRDLGVAVKEADGRIFCECKRLSGGEVYLDYPSVGATENLMMASSVSDGATIISNAAKEPEIVDLQNFINLMGGRISGAGTGKIVIHGVEKLHGCTYSPIPDRIVTGTFMLALSACGGEMLIKNAVKEHLTALIGKLRDGGINISECGEGLLISSRGRMRASRLIETMPYPGFPTDLQSPMMALQAVADGSCVLIENVFENRLRLAGELKKMGADITVRERMAIIHGVKELHGANVTAHDLRGGAALIVAGLAANGITEISDAGFIERGYWNFTEQLASLGGDIKSFET